MDEDRLADAVSDVGADVVQQLRKISDDLGSIRTWVAFFGGLVVTWLIISVLAGAVIGVMLVVAGH